MTDLMTDLKTRWHPSNSQDLAAANVLADKPGLEYVYTAHMLLNKNYGCWTEDVKVLPLTPNVFASRDEVLRFLEGAAAAARVVNPSALFTTGYAIHHRRQAGSASADLTDWAVFEDILATSSGDGDN